MGERKIFKKRKPGAQCALGRESSGTVISEPCVCADWDFEWWVPNIYLLGDEDEDGAGERGVMTHRWEVCFLAYGPDCSSSWAWWEVCSPRRRTRGDIFTGEVTVLSEQYVWGNFSSSVSSPGQVPERLVWTLTKLKELPPWTATSRSVAQTVIFHLNSLLSSFFSPCNDNHREQL